MNDDKVCPLFSICQQDCFKCLTSQCAWWVEDKQRCAITALGAKK